MSESDAFCPSCGAARKAAAKVTQYNREGGAGRNFQNSNFVQNPSMPYPQGNAYPQEDMTRPKKSKKTLIIGLSVAGALILAIVAVIIVLLVNANTKADNEQKRASKARTDMKNADEIASQIATSIADYETAEIDGKALGYLLDGEENTSVTIQWNAEGARIISGGTSNDEVFLSILGQAITTSTRSKENGEYAVVEIGLKNQHPSDGYAVTVTVGNQTSHK